MEKIITENIRLPLLSVCFLILNIKARKLNVLFVEIRFQNCKPSTLERVEHLEVLFTSDVFSDITWDCILDIARIAKLQFSYQNHVRTQSKPSNKRVITVIWIVPILEQYFFFSFTAILFLWTGGFQKETLALPNIPWRKISSIIKNSGFRLFLCPAFCHKKWQNLLICFILSFYKYLMFLQFFSNFLD